MKNYEIVRIINIDLKSIFDLKLEQYPDFEKLSYDKMIELAFANNMLAYSDGFSRSFSELGQDANEIIPDFEILQKQWAKENGIRYDSENWMMDIFMAQIKSIKPDIIYFDGSGWTIPGRFFSDRTNDNLIKILKEEYSFIKKVIVFSGYPSGADRIKGADIFFTCGPSLTDAYRKMGLEPILLYHSFDDSILSKLNGKGSEYNFTFVGSTRAPELRYWYLRKLMAETDLQGWIRREVFKDDTKHINFKAKQVVRLSLKKIFQLLNDNQLFFLSDSKYIPDKIRQILDEIAQEKNLENKGTVVSLQEFFPKRCNKPVMGMDYYNLLHDSRITFNKHANLSWGCVGNMRMFEATGLGTCLLTDTGRNMTDLFEEDKEVVVYRNIDEAIEKVRYLQDHPDKVIEIAKSGQARTLRDHTIMNRCQQIDEVIQINL